MFETLDGREEFEDHEEDQDEAGQDDGIDVTLNTDNFGESITEIREEYNGSHATPDDDASDEFE